MTNGTCHFFTGTIFHDANSNTNYDEGEGIGGFEVRLSVGGSPHSSYDVSAPGGNFAIPITSIGSGSDVDVIIKNVSGSAQTISIPIGFWTLGNLTLANNEEYTYGTFTQPSGRENVGFRNVVPKVEESSMTYDHVGGQYQIHAATMPGGRYVVQSSDDLLAGTWLSFDTNVAVSTVTVFSDTGQAGRSHPSTVPYRFYRVRLLRD
jgi:hypothetical protein